MKIYLNSLLFILILMASCSKPQSSFQLDNPTQDAYYSAVGYSRFFDNIQEKKDYSNIKLVVREHNTVFKRIKHTYDSLLAKTYKKDAQEQVLELESQYKDWEDKTHSIIDKYHLTKDYDTFDSLSRQRTSYSQSSSSSNEEQLKADIKIIMSSSEIPCLDLNIAESGCLWVYTTDNGKNRDGLAQTLCYTAKKYSVNCVTVYNKNQKVLGRSQCNGSIGKVWGKLKKHLFCRKNK